MLSRDASGLDPNSVTHRRWNLLRENGIELDVVVSMRGKGESQIARLRRMHREATRILSAHRADLITAQDPFEIGFIAYILSRQFQVPFEIQDHGGFFDGETPDEPLWILRKYLARFLATRAARIRTVSPKSFERLGREKAYFLPIGVDARFALIERHPESGLIVTVSRLIHVKRTDLLIRTIAKLTGEGQRVHLVIVGDGPERPTLEHLVSALGISDHVRFVGAGDPAPWLERAALFVTLSSHEGWGIASVEAAMAGVPVLMTDTGCGRWLEERRKAEIILDPSSAQTEIEKALLGTPWFDRVPLETASPMETAKQQVDAWQSVVRATES